MGFSLRELLNLNNNEKRKKAEERKPQPANTARPQQGGLSVQPVQQQSLIPSIQPVQSPAPLKVGVAAPKPLQVGNQTIQPSPQARTAPVALIQQAQNKANQAQQNFHAPQDPLSRAAGYVAKNFIAQPAAEIAATVTNRPITPNKFTAPILGNTPIKPIQQDVKGVYNEVKSGHQNLPGGIPISPSLAVPYAATAGLLHVANDAPIGGALVKSTTKLVKEAAPVIKTVNEARIPIANEIGAVGKNVNKTPSPTTKLIPESNVTPVNIPKTPSREVVQNTNIPENQSAGFKPLSIPQSTQELPIVGAPVPSGFASGAQRSAEVSVPTKAILKQNQPTYEVRNTQKLANEAEQFSGDLKKATTSVNERLAVPNGNVDDKTVADAIAVAKAHDANGEHDLASSIYEGLSPHLTKQGQSIQAASLLSNRTPEGLKFQAIKTLKKHGVETSPELQTKLDDAYKAVKATAQGSDERFRASQEYAKLVADNLPSTVADKATAFWKAGLLTGVKTQTGNALSNATFGALHNLSNPLAVGIDKALSLRSGVRTKSLTGKGLLSGTKEGLSKGKDVLKTGIDERPGLINKYDQSSGLTFGNQHGEVQFGDSPAGKAATTYVNGVFRLMGAADRPAYYAQLRNSLADLGKTDGINQGLRGSNLRKYVDNFVKNPPKEPFQLATNEAEKSVLANDTFLSNVANKVRRAADEVENPLGRGVAKTGVNVLMPFTKVPSAFISRVFDFTPVGVVKTAGEQIANKKIDQRTLSTAISEAGTGTGLIYLGVQLAKNGLLSGNYPTDPKEQARWKAEGIQPNAVNAGGKWLSLNYFGPLGALFSQGKRAGDTLKEGGGATDIASGFLGGGAQDALNQSFLQGVSGAFDVVADPKRNGPTYVKNQAGSIIPTLSGDIANATDSKQRDSNTAGQAIEAKIPGLRQGLRIKQDIYGNDLGAKTSPLDALANPFRPSNAVTNDVKSEVARLHNVDPNNKDLQVTPTPLDKTITVDKNRVKLDNKQRYDLQKQIGQATQKNWDKLIKMPEYQALNDADKANALNNLRQASSEDTQREYVVNNNLGTYGKNASKSAIKVSQGELTSFAKEKGSKTSDTADYYKAPDAEYKDLKSKYDDKIKNGFNSDASKIKAEKALNKAKVGASFDKSVRDLYGLSKSDVYDYVSKNSNGQKIADQLIAYDKALYDAGLTKYKSFANGIAPISKTASRKSGGGKKSASSSFATALKYNATASKNQSALLKLVKGSKIRHGSKLNVTKVTLKKQSAKNQKVKVS